MSAKCRSCGAPIEWATSETTGKSIPLDLVPTANGNLVLVNGRSRYYSADDVKLHRERRTSHFATCPDAKQWRGG